MLFRDRWWVVVAGILLLAVLNELEVVQVRKQGKQVFGFNRYHICLSETCMM